MAATGETRAPCEIFPRLPTGGAEARLEQLAPFSRSHIGQVLSVGRSPHGLSPMTHFDAPWGWRYERILVPLGCGVNPLCNGMGYLMSPRMRPTTSWGSRSHTRSSSSSIPVAKALW